MEKGKTVWDFLVYLLEKRRYLFAIILFGAVPFLSLLSVALVFYFVLQPKVEVGSSGVLTVKSTMFGPRITTVLVHSMKMPIFSVLMTMDSGMH